jgi:hypothetical protein
MRTLFAPAVLTVFLGLGMAAIGQQAPGQGAPPSQPGAQEPRAGGAQDQGERVSLTGCLAKGTQSNQYEITDKSSHEKVAFPGPSQLDQYVNQTVTLTGTMMAAGNGQKIFRPDSINRISNSC